MRGGSGGSNSSGGGGGAPTPPPLRLPLPSGCFLDHLPPAQKRARFNLLLLEHGEVYLGDYAVVRYRGKGRTKIRVPGRLKVSSRSLVFDPVGDASQPLLRFPYKHVARLSKYTPSAGEALEYGGEGTEGLFIFSCSSLLEMKADDLVAPYVQRRCGVDDYEGPDFVFRLQHTPLPGFLGTVDHLLKISAELARTGATAHAEETLLRPLLEERERASAAFDLTHLVDFREKLLLAQALPVDRISPLIRNPGVVMLTDKRLYFQPAADLNNVGSAHPVSFPLSAIVQVFKRRYMLRQTGLEVFYASSDHPSSEPASSPSPSPPPSGILSPTSNGGGVGGSEKLRSILLAFRSSQDRDRVYDLMMAQPELQGLQQPRVAEVTRAWQARRISNLEYLSYLNTLADRSYNDLTQYPVFPWVLADYTSRKLDWDDPKTYRDLSKPIGALNEERLAYLRERMRSMPDPNPALGVPPKFLYGTHYSTPGYVLFYLVRAAPEYMLCLQDGKFDAADRMFVSVAETWRSCLSNPADLKELIPEFYCSQGEFLVNVDGLPLGTTQGGVRVDDVGLPPWAKSERDFVKKLRKALNDSAYVSAHLHKWIDLIFGHKQRGAAAEGADNLFYYLTYEGAVDLEKVEDPVERAAFEAQIREFGQTPKQVFVGPHPARDAPPGEASPVLLAPAFQDPHAPPSEGGSPVPYLHTSSPSAPVPIPPSLPTATDGAGASSLSAASTDSGGGSGGMGGSMMRPRGGSGTEEWEMIRGDSLSLSMSMSLSQSASGGWELLSRRASETNGGGAGGGGGGGTDGVSNSQLQQQLLSLSSHGGDGEESAVPASGPSSLSPASRITKGLALPSPGSSARRAGHPPLPPSAAPAAAAVAVLVGTEGGQENTPRTVGSIRIDEQAQSRLEAMIRRAQESGDVELADSLRLASAGRGGNGGGDASPAFPLSPFAVGRSGGEDDEGLPAVVRLEDLVSASELEAGAALGGGGDKGLDGGNATGGGAPDDAALALASLRLEGSPPLSLHRDKVSCLQWAEGGAALVSTSDDGSFRVSGLSLENNAEEGGGLKAALRSKRHFAPSDIALSCCAFLGDGDAAAVAAAGGSSNPLAVLSSWDNHVYVYSIRSARQLLKLDAHDDGVSALAVACSPHNGSGDCLLATGSWDATVKVWALRASGEIDPAPVSEFFDLAAQVQTVAICSPSSALTLLAAGAEDGRVAIWDVKARSLVTTFQATVGSAPAAAVRWGGGGGSEPRLYVAGGDGSLACYAVDGQRLGLARVDCELRSLELGRAEGGVEVLVAGGGDGSLRLWSGAAFLSSSPDSPAPASPLLTIRDAHAGAVTAVAVDWGKGLVASGSQDASVRVWQVQR